MCSARTARLVTCSSSRFDSERLYRQMRQIEKAWRGGSLENRKMTLPTGDGLVGAHASEVRADGLRPGRAAQTQPHHVPPAIRTIYQLMSAAASGLCHLGSRLFGALLLLMRGL